MVVADGLILLVALFVAWWGWSTLGPPRQYGLLEVVGLNAAMPPGLVLVGAWLFFLRGLGFYDPGRMVNLVRSLGALSQSTLEMLLVICFIIVLPPLISVGELSTAQDSLLFTLAPLPLGALFRENLRRYTLVFSLYSLGVLLLFLPLAIVGEFSFPALVLNVIIWLNGFALLEIKMLVRDVNWHCSETLNKNNLFQLKRWPELVLLLFPPLMVLPLPALVPLVILITLTPLNQKAYRLWVEHILPNSGRHELWARLGYLVTQETQLQQENSQQEKQETAQSRQSPAVSLDEETLGWDAVDDLVYGQLLENQDGVFEAVLGIYGIAVLVALLLGGLNTLIDGGGISAFLESSSLILCFIWMLLSILVMVLIGLGTEFHPAVSAALSHLRSSESAKFDWFHLLPFPQSFVLRKTVRFLGSQILKSLVPILGSATIVTVFIGEGSVYSFVGVTLFLLLIMLFCSGLHWYAVFSCYWEPSRRRSKT